MVFFLVGHVVISANRERLRRAAVRITRARVRGAAACFANRFVFTAQAMLARYVLRPCVCLGVSVCHKSEFYQNEKNMMRQLTPHDTQKTLVKFERRHPDVGDKWRWDRVKSANFDKELAISKTAQNRHIVSTKNKKSYTLYRMVTLPVTLSDPLPPQTSPFSIFCNVFNMFATCDVRDFKFGA